MRRISTVITATTLALSLTLGLGAGPAQAAAGYDSSYQFESAFLSLAPGDSGTFAVFFANTGSTAWVKGSSTQVNLSICASDKIKVPTGQASGTYRFNGDLVVGVSGEKLHPEGYYQDAAVTAPVITLGITPGYDVTEDNEVSTAVPGNGQHTYTVTTTFTGTMSFAILPSSNITRNSDGTFNFCDTNADKKADGVSAGSTFFTAVNGSSVPASTVLINQTIPSNGQMTVAIDSSTRNQRVRVIVWQDKSQNGQIELTTAGPDATCNTLQPYDTTTDGAIVVSGRKFYFGPKGQFGAQFPDGAGNAQCEPVYRHNSATQTFSAGPTSDTSLRYTYDSNDIFQIGGTQVQLSLFQSSLNPQIDGTGSTIKVNYDPNSSGFSTFNICNTSGSNAPSNVSAATGNFDSGSAAEDVRISFTAPANNQISTYNIQRANVSGTAALANCALGATAPSTSDSSGTPAGTSFATIGSVSVTAGQQGTFTNFDLANGGYCYRVTATNPNIGQISYSNYVPVNIPGTADATAPTSTSAVQTSSSGFANTLDTGDKLVIDFSESMSIATGATIRVTDSDCGNATNAGPAACSGGSN